MKIIITGITGMVGEGVLLSCLQLDEVSEIVTISRKPIHLLHKKLKSLVVSDFKDISTIQDQLIDFDACFFCAGISSVGLSKEKYFDITYTTTIDFAKSLHQINPQMTFCYISGSSTDTTEKGKVNWARVKGKTENDLLTIGFKQVYNLRPGIMTTVDGQRYVKRNFKILLTVLLPFFRIFANQKIISLKELAIAMIECSKNGYEKNILEISDIKTIASRH